jgi:hypothetical protein
VARAKRNGYNDGGGVMAGKKSTISKEEAQQAIMDEQNERAERARVAIAKILDDENCALESVTTQRNGKLVGHNIQVVAK